MYKHDFCKAMRLKILLLAIHLFVFVAANAQEPVEDNSFEQTARPSLKKGLFGKVVDSKAK
jgi:hypothetical protein